MTDAETDTHGGPQEREIIQITWVNWERVQEGGVGMGAWGMEKAELRDRWTGSAL